MTRIFHLSHLLDKDGYNRINLVSFYELSKLDEFIIARFKSHKDVRKKYEMDISEFCLDNMKMIQEENKRNHHNWTGSIAIICEERDKDDNTGLIYKVPIIYQNDHKLLPKEDCLNKIKNRLNDFNTMLLIYEDKKELLSENERHLIILYRNSGNIRFLKSAIGFFFNRLKRMEDDELLYFYCRDLMNICELNELSIQTKFGNINHINIDIPKETKLVKKSGFSKDRYFNELIANENYEELFNTYDIDEIDRDSDLFKEGKRK